MSSTVRVALDASVATFDQCVASARSTTCLSSTHGERSRRPANTLGVGPTARNLVDCTIHTHAGDIETVVTALRAEGYGPIVVLGHSLGGLSALVADPQSMDAVVLWDGTHTAHWPEQVGFEDEFTTYEPALDLYINRGGIDSLLSAAYLDYRRVDGEALIARLQCPVLIVVAGATPFAEVFQRYFAVANEPKSLAVIAGADHNFTTGDTMDELLGETISWLDRTFPSS